MIAGVMSLNWKDIKTPRLTDDYSIHRIVYSLFEDIRTESEKKQSIPSGFIYADKGGDASHREILFLSHRPPKEPIVGTLRVKSIPDAFLEHDVYAFEVIVNPTKRVNGRLIPIKGKENICKWFINRTSSWGFEALSSEVIHERLLRTSKNETQITIKQATLKGLLRVTDRSLFIQHFRQGLGRGKAFGCGLLQIVPVNISNSN